jgi:dCMP deaminase
MPSQIKLDNAYMDIATRWGRMSHATRKQVGCIIVKEGQIISDGYNGTPHGFDNDCEFPTRFGLETKPEVLHAESNAISKLARSVYSSQNATVYITLSPCFDCAKLMIQCGIDRVVYNEIYRDISGIDLLQKANIHCSNLESFL